MKKTITTSLTYFDANLLNNLWHFL